MNGIVLQRDLPQADSGLLGSDRVDIKTCAPLETGHLGQLGHNLDVPVIMAVVGFLEGHGMDNIIERRIIQRSIEPDEGLSKGAREIDIFLL